LEVWKKLALNLTWFDNEKYARENGQLMDFWKLLDYRLGSRFFNIARSNVINPNRISSTKGMTSGKIKSATNTAAANASNFGKRSLEA
jgi:hypothetical protein